MHDIRLAYKKDFKIIDFTHYLEFGWKENYPEATKYHIIKTMPFYWDRCTIYTLSRDY